MFFSVTMPVSLLEAHYLAGPHLQLPGLLGYVLNPLLNILGAGGRLSLAGRHVW